MGNHLIIGKPKHLNLAVAAICHKSWGVLA